MFKTLLFFFSISYILSNAQKQGNIWYFGQLAGLDFKNDTPIAIHSGKITFATHNEGTACISDSSGKIIMYTDGEKIWNRQHNLMPNGIGLLGSYSTTQSSMIIPDPGNPNKFFYVFTLGSGYCCNAGGFADGLRYSKVDICIDSAKGDIISGQKNILLTNTLTEKLAAARHRNGKDYWILVHKYNTNRFYSYKLSATGITSVISDIGSIHDGFTS